jgi:hypothetical protein
LDFSREMLVVVFGRAAIESVSASEGIVRVGFRALDSEPQPQQRWRVVARSELPVVFALKP